MPRTPETPHLPLNPLTVLVAAGSVMVLVLGVNEARLSAAVAVAAVALGSWRTRSAAVGLLSLGLVVPTAASMVLIHAPHGQERIAPLLTADGLATAGELSLRFAALITPLLAAMTFIRVPELVKALQGSRLDHRVSYIVGAALQFLPQGRRAVGVVRDAQRLAGRRTTVATAVPHLALPVMTHVLTQGARRADALEAAGMDLPGRRTVLRPVPDGPVQRVVRIVLPVAAAAVVVAGWI